MTPSLATTRTFEIITQANSKLEAKIPNKIMELILKQVKTIVPETRFAWRAKSLDGFACIKWPTNNDRHMSLSLSSGNLALNWDHHERMKGSCGICAYKIPLYDDPEFVPEDIIRLASELVKKAMNAMKKMEEIRKQALQDMLWMVEQNNGTFHPEGSDDWIVSLIKAEEVK